MTVSFPMRPRAPFERPIHRPQGAIRQSDGSMEWRLWAPLAESVDLIIERNEHRETRRMMAEPHGYHVFRASAAEEGLRYAYGLPDGREYPDPASRWQPGGVHEPSAVFFPEEYDWSDAHWRGIARDELVIYELHVGTFTPEGTFDAVIPRLDQLKSLGVTAIEIMPVGQFPGNRNWGYDGAYLHAAQNSYGGPRALQRLVNAAHGKGLAVLLDVVYNHVGPEGNYLAQFGPYFTDRYRTPWGDAMNFDGPQCDAVRAFVVHNACMWIRDFHMDGLRLDAVHAIYDFGARHILDELRAEVHAVSRQEDRTVHVIAESDQNDVRLIDSDGHGFGLDAVWSDDFHHSVHALLTGDLEGYYQDFGHAEHLAKAYQRVFVYDGCHSSFRRRRHGSVVEDRDRTRFVVCVHNHDQVGNRAAGDRIASYLPEPAQRLACGLLMLSPCVPLLFMGEEYAENRPFPFFCSFGDAELIEAVRRGRREEFASLDFKWGDNIPDPQSATTFESAKLNWNWPDGSCHARMRQLYADFLKARRVWPPLRDRRHTAARLMGSESSTSRTTGPTILVVERGTGEPIVGFANLSAAGQPLPEIALGNRTPLLSTEDRLYGGPRDLALPTSELYPYELIVFGPQERPQ